MLWSGLPGFARKRFGHGSFHPAMPSGHPAGSASRTRPTRSSFITCRMTTIKKAMPRALSKLCVGAQRKDAVMSGVKTRSRDVRPNRRGGEVDRRPPVVRFRRPDDADGERSSPPDALTLFKNYFVTGNYFVYRVPLKGTGSEWLCHRNNQRPWRDSVPRVAQAIAAHLAPGLTVTSTSSPLAGHDRFDVQRATPEPRSGKP